MWEARALRPFMETEFNISGLVIFEEEAIRLGVTLGDISLFCFVLYIWVTI